MNNFIIALKIFDELHELDHVLVSNYESYDKINFVHNIIP